MIKDQDKEYVMEFLSNMLNNEYDLETVDYKAYHVPYAEIPRQYGEYKITSFFFFYRLDCLYEKGLITLSVKNKLLELYQYYSELDEEYGDYAMKANNIRRDIDDMEYKGTLTETKLKELKGKIKKEEHKTLTICNKMKEVKKIFDNYHLFDKINLSELIGNSVRVDKNIDLDEKISKVRK